MDGNYTLENFANDSGFMVNMQLITNPVFSGVSPRAVMLYGIFKHRLYSSFRHSDKFSDENGLFIYFPVKEICELFNTDNMGTAKKWLKELRDFKLIETKAVGLGKPQKIYLKTVAYAICSLGGVDSNGNIIMGDEKYLEAEDEPECEDYEYDDIFSQSIKRDSNSIGQKVDLRGAKKCTFGTQKCTAEVHRNAPPYSIEKYSNKIPDNNTEEIVEKQKAQAHFCPPQPPKKTRKKKTFVEPTLEEVKQFFTENNFVLDAEDFLLKQQQRGWLLKNGQHVVDWKASARLWNRNEVKYRSEKGNGYAYRGRISERERFKPTESTDPDDWRIV